MTPGAGRTGAADDMNEKTMNVNEINDILNMTGFEGLDALDEIVRRCDESERATSGIPSVIALDDLTKPEQGAFSLAKTDEAAGFAMAVTALLLTDIYENKDERDQRYPAVCFAMIGLADRWFDIHGGEGPPFAVSSYALVEETLSGNGHAPCVTK
jgi:hypothetical protein